MGIAAQGQIPTITVGGRVITDLENLKMMAAQLNTTAEYVTFRTQDGTQYQVPTGKKLVVVAKQFINSETGYANMTLGYGDTSTTGTVPTNPVREYSFSFGPEVKPGEGQILELPSQFEVPAGKYPFCYDGGPTPGGTMTIYAYEVDA